ncbi:MULTISPECIES: redoxin domain-containing protein [Robertmurraya]|uniref:TlpA family protein disulfide reductase n=1 Tax=Robertmurraya beringensis TaxID=641660 RepID=A0ABV6KVP4_9BACI
MKKTIKIVLLGLLLWAFVFTVNKEITKFQSISKSTVNTEQLPQKNFQRPSFSLTGLDGKQYSTDEVSKPLVINFWASWCGPCKVEAPELVKLYQKYNDKVEIFAVNLTEGDSKEAAKKFADSYGFQFPVLLDTDNKVSDMYRVTAIPTTYFVNRDGIIVDQILGFGGVELFEDKFEKLAKE